MAPVEGVRVYSTRLRTKKVDTDLKYDDIFSSVVKKVTNEEEFYGLSKRLINENTVRERARFLSTSSTTSVEAGSYCSGESKDSDDDYSPCGSARRRSPQKPLQSLQGSPKKRGTSLKLSPSKRHAESVCTTDSDETEESGGKKKKFVCPVCTVEGEERVEEAVFDRHMQLHNHVIEKHPTFCCPVCKLAPRALRAKHICSKCGDFAVNVNDHLISVHYAQSQREGALLECCRCSRTFRTLPEVQAHERKVHAVSRRGKPLKRLAKVRTFPCRSCGSNFASRYLRDQHFTSHFQSVIESVWTTIEEMQEQHPERILVNQCPLCQFVMSSRKSFRTHIIHRHLMYDESALEKLVGPNVKQEELDTVREHIAHEHKDVVMKAEVKEEDDDSEEIDDDEIVPEGESSSSQSTSSNNSEEDSLEKPSDDTTPDTNTNETESTCNA